jgi:hypothetical protein
MILQGASKDLRMIEGRCRIDAERTVQDDTLHIRLKSVLANKIPLIVPHNRPI